MNEKIKAAVAAATEPPKGQLEHMKGPGPQNILASLIPPPPAVRRPEFSVIICSPDTPEGNIKLEGVTNAYKIAFAGDEYELIAIKDAKSLAEGYLRGIERSVGSIVVFSHNDAAPVRPIGAKLRRHLQRVDIVGGAGSNRLDGPAWFTAGPPHGVGQVLNQILVPKLDEKGQPIKNAAGDTLGEVQFLLSVYGVPSRLVEGIQVLDGFWFAARREVLRFDKAWFDPELCDGFHMYDIDFSYRAFLNGVRIGVACDLSLLHASSGGYGDPKWKPAADRWMARFGERLAQHRDLAWQYTSVAGRSQPVMLSLMDEILERAEA